MKKLILFAFVLLSLTTVQSKTMTEYGGDGYFYTALAPYGEWIELNDGVTVWRPIMMQRNWEPYTIGHWEWTADGWYWDSDEPFGYITYHYGRWYNDEFYGWIWVPDDQWAPACVEWRYDDDYVGWAPLSPYGEFRIGFGIYFTHEYHPPYRYWNFVAYNHFCDMNVYHYYAGPTYKYRIYDGTRFRNDYDYNNGRVINRGIGYDIVRERGGRPIRTHEIIRTTDPRVIKENGRDNNVIRTYVATRNDISRNNVRDITIKKPDRKTTMDVSKVTLGERNTTVRNDVTQERQTPVVDRNTGLQNRDLLEQQNRQKQQQIDQQNRQKQLDAQRQQQVDQQNKQTRQNQQRQIVNQQNNVRQQQIDQQNRQRQQVQQRQNVDQQNKQRQQVQQRQTVDQQNRQRQQVQQRQNVDQQNRQRQQVDQKRQQTNQRNDTKDNGKDRR
jgi:hypothetical protein